MRAFPFRNRAFLGLALALAMGCAPAEEENDDDDSEVDWSGPGVTYVGELGATDALLGVIVKEHGVITYSCGGDDTLDDLTTWISGAWTGGSFEVSRGDGRIEGTVSGDEQTVSGMLRISGDEHEYTLDRVAETAAEGLYGAGLEDDDCLTGVLVLPPETAGGALRIQGASTCGAFEDTFNQVTPGFSPTDALGFDVTVPAWSSAPFTVRKVEVAPRY